MRGGLRQHAFEAEEEFLHVQAAPVAHQRPVRTDHPVAGDEDGDGVGAIGPRRGADALLIAQAASQFLSQQAGYATVYNVMQGIKGWIGAGGPVVPANQTIASCKAAKTC